MKEIYNQVRAILDVQHKNPDDHPLDPGLTQSLLLFEQCNRGHRHLLDSPLLLPETNLSEHPNRKHLESCRETLESSKYGLMNTLFEDQHLFSTSHGRLQGLLNARTKHNLIGQRLYWLSLLELQAVMKGVTGRMMDYTLANNELSLKLTFQMTMQAYEVTRLWKFAIPDPFTVHDALKLVTQVRRDVRKDLDTMKDWPEFQPSTLEEVQLQRARQELDSLMRAWSSFKRKVVLENWDRVRPRLNT